MRETEDLTTGKIERQLAALALPLILGNVLQQFYNTVDSLIIGRYIGNTAFAAAGTAGSVMNLFTFVISGGCGGVAVIFADLYGRKEEKVLRRESFVSFALGFLCTVFLGAAGLLTLEPLMEAMRTPEAVATFAGSYLKVIYFGLPAVFLYNWCSAALQAAGDTRASLLGLGAAMLLNTGLDFLLAVHWNMGIAGAAAATVISQIFAAAVCLVYMKFRHPCMLFGPGDVVFDGGLIRKTANYASVCALRQSSLYIGKLLVQGAVNTAGTSIISAYAITARIEGFANSFGDSGSTAISVFIAWNRGAGKSERVREGFRRGLKMMVVLGIFMSVLMVLTAPQASGIFVKETTAVLGDSVRAYINIIALFYVLCFIGSSFVGLYSGLGMVHVPAVGSALHISIRAVLSWALIGKMGLPAVALATGAGWVVVVIFQVIIAAVFLPSSALKEK